MPYVKDGDHILKTDSVHDAYRESDTTITVYVMTGAGIQALGLSFKTKNKADAFWTLLDAAMT